MTVWTKAVTLSRTLAYAAIISSIFVLGSGSAFAVPTLTLVFEQGDPGAAIENTTTYSYSIINFGSSITITSIIIPEYQAGSFLFDSATRAGLADGMTAREVSSIDASLADIAQLAGGYMPAAYVVLDLATPVTLGTGDGETLVLGFTLYGTSARTGLATFVGVDGNDLSVVLDPPVPNPEPAGLAAIGAGAAALAWARRHGRRVVA